MVCRLITFPRHATSRLGARAELAGETCLLALASSLQSDPAEMVREAGSSKSSASAWLAASLCAGMRTLHRANRLRGQRQRNCFQGSFLNQKVQGLSKLARESLLAAADDDAAFVRDAISSATDSLPQLGREDFDMPQSAWQ